MRWEDYYMLHKHFTDNRSEQSVATRLRRRRFQILLDMFREQPSCRVTILDIGGRLQYWEIMTAGMSLTHELKVTLLNVEGHTVSHPNFTALVGDGRAMPQFADKQFDIVFSNSTIEHVGGFPDQQRMAREIRRIGRRYYIQTPNRYFPIEPHFVFPLFQFLPIGLRMWLVQHFNLGWYRKLSSQRDTEREVTSIRLLNRREVVELFPEATIFEEKYYGLVKSFVAYTPSTSTRLN
jgi:hypothetical protein